MKIEKIKEIIELLNDEEEDDYNVSRVRNGLSCMLATQYWKEKGFNIEDGQSNERCFYKVETPDLYEVAWLNKWLENSVLSNNKKQPEVGKWIFKLSFSTGAYIFGDDYDTETFNEFFTELIEKYNPDFRDDLNHSLYWYVDNPNASKIANDVNSIYKKYLKNRNDRIKKYRIKELEKEIARLKGNN